MFHHQATKGTKKHQVKVLSFLVELGVLGALVVKFCFILVLLVPLR